MVLLARYTNTRGINSYLKGNYRIYEEKLDKNKMMEEELICGLRKMKGINENEIDEMFEFCKKHGIILQLIELMDSENCDDEKFSREYHYNLDPVNEKLLSICDEVKTREFMQNRKKYFIDGREIEVVKPIENSDFCANCTRLRITPDGKIKPCLLRNDNLVELISHIRNNETDSELKEVFIKGINKREPYNS